MPDDLLAAVNAGLEHTIPRAYEMGVRFVELRRGFVRAELPFEGNGNHFGTIYAGVIFTLAEVLGGALHFACFDATTHYPLVRGMSIEFIAPGRGPLSASARSTTRRSSGCGPRPGRIARRHSNCAPKSSAMTAPWSRGRWATTRSVPTDGELRAAPVT